METRITVEELKATLAEVLDRVCNKGERFTVEQNGVVIAEVGPPDERLGRPAREVFAGLENLYVPEGFGDDLEWVKQNQGILPEPPEWPD